MTNSKEEFMRCERKIRWASFLGLVFTFILTLGSGVALADPPPWAPAHGYRAKHHHDARVYKYMYYPGAQVYYSPVRHGYYFLDNGAWTYSTVVPAGIRLGNAVSIELGGPVPYVYHPTVIQQYPVIVVP
jgi:hypothetical protein